GGSKFPFDTSTRGPSDQSARSLERRPGTGGWQASLARPSRRELGFAIGEPGSDVPQQVGVRRIASPRADGAERIEFTAEHARRRNDRGRRSYGPLRAGSIEVSFKAPHPIRSVLPVVADLAATDEPVVAYLDRGRYDAERQRSAETSGSRIR